MKTKFTLLILQLLFTSTLLAQNHFTVKDKETNEPIPYVNIYVQGENSGATADENGVFILRPDMEDKTLLFSALGFDDVRVPAKNLPEIIYLTPAVIELNEAVIDHKKEKLELSVDKFRKSQSSHNFGSNGYPWMVGKFFKYKQEYENTPYVSKIRILTTSEIDSAVFNLRLYLPNEEGKPGSYLYDRNILCKAKKGKKITEVDVSDLNIVFPETGFFIAFEWLIIDHNKYEYRHSIEGQPGRYDGISYEPSIGALPAENAANHWVFTHGAWYVRNSGYKYHSSALAIELILSN